MKRRLFFRISGLAAGTLFVPSTFSRGILMAAGQSSNSAIFHLQIASSAGFERAELAYDVTGLTDVSFEVSGLRSGTTYFWRVQTLKGQYASEWSNVVSFTAGALVDTSDDEVPRAIELGQNYPNPFNPSTTIPVTLAEAAHVNVAVFDMLGRHVETLLSGTMPAGRHEVRWNAAAESSGTFLYVLSADSHSETRQMVLMK